MHTLTESPLIKAQDYAHFAFKLYLDLIDYYESETLLDWDLTLDSKTLHQHHYVGFTAQCKGYISWQIQFTHPALKTPEMDNLSIVVVLQLCLVKGNSEFKQIAKQLSKHNYRVDETIQSFNTRILPATTTLLSEQVQINLKKGLYCEADGLIQFFTQHFDKILKALNQVYVIEGAQ